METKNDILDPSWMRWEGDFESQVHDLFGYVRLTRGEVEGLRCLLDDVENTLRTNWPGCEVIPFGSIVTGMGIKTSDVDCYVEIPAWYKHQGDGNFVIRARNVFRRHSNVFAELFAITTAKVPIVKFYHVPTRRHCDLSFKSPSGVRNSKLISYLLHLDQRAHYLAILVKYWSKVHKLTGTNLLANYALTLLVIFYLQHARVLPPVSLLQENVPHNLVDGWNTAFSEHPQGNDNVMSLYELLGGFFSFYSTFNFEENIISTYLGYAIVRESFKKPYNVPQEFELYKTNIKNRSCMPLKLNTFMCIQDPFDHSRNCTVAVFPKLAYKICELFRLGSRLYQKESNESFLRVLLTARSQGPARPMAARKNKGPKTQNNVPKVQNKVVPIVQNKVVKPYRPNQNYKTLKKNLQHNLHALYTEINKRAKR